MFSYVDNYACIESVVSESQFPGVTLTSASIVYCHILICLFFVPIFQNEFPIFPNKQFRSYFFVQNLIINKIRVYFLLLSDCKENSGSNENKKLILLH